MAKPSIGHGPFLVLLGALCFSTSGLSQAIAPQGASPYTVAALRMFIGGCALLLWCACRGILPRRGGWPLRNVLPASLGLLLCTTFFFKGTATAGVVVGTVVTLGSIPLFAALLGMVILGERPARAWYPATAVAILGLTLLNWGGSGELNPLYLAYPLAAGLAYSAFMVCGKSLVRQHPPETVQMVLSLLAGICLLPAFLYFPGAWVFTLNGALVALNLGITTSALAFTLVLAGLRTTQAATASTLGLAEPLCASLIGIFYLREPLTPFTSAGLLCLLAAMLLLIVLSPRAPRPDADQA